MLVTWQTNYDSSRLFLFDFKVCALSYCSDIGREGFFCAYILQYDIITMLLLTHKSVKAANFKP